jgi:hypothetical protein
LDQFDNRCSRLSEYDFRPIGVICDCALIYHDEEWVDVQRSDTAHGCPHQDILGKKGGLLQKVWYDDLISKEVFTLAISTFKSNHEKIKEDFFAH